jgi:hypothetical protein
LSKPNQLTPKSADAVVEIPANIPAPKKMRRTKSPLSPVLPASARSMRRAADGGPAWGAETVDDESLGTWLTMQTPKVMTAIAARTALRLIPCQSRHAPKGGDPKVACQFSASTGASFRACALARVVTKYPQHAKELRAIALRAAEDAAAALMPGALALSAAAFAAATAELGAKESAFALVFQGQFEDAAPFGAAYAAAAAAADPALRGEILSDVSAMQRFGADKLADLPLWRGDLPDWWKHDWQRLMAALPRDEDWEVWIEWYNERFVGGSPGEVDELVFASSPPEVWDAGPAATNAWIRAHLELPQRSGVDSPSCLSKPT